MDRSNEWCVLCLFYNIQTLEDRERETEVKQTPKKKKKKKERQEAMATAYSTSMAVLGSRLPTTTTTSRGSAFPLLPHRPSTLSFTTNIKHLTDSRRSLPLQIRASEETSGSVEVGEIFSDLQEKWDAVENKSTVLIYGGGAIVGIWLSSIVVGAINTVPLLPKLMELVGLGYTGWFVYRYLLFKSSRKELATDIESLKKKIAGTE